MIKKRVKCGNSHVSVFSSKRHVKRDMDFLSLNERRDGKSTEKCSHFFFSLVVQLKHNRKKKQRETLKRKKLWSFYLRARCKLRRRREREREMPGGPPPPRLLLPCWQDVMLNLGTDSLRECQREILNRAGFPT